MLQFTDHLMQAQIEYISGANVATSMEQNGGLMMGIRFISRFLLVVLILFENW